MKKLDSLPITNKHLFETFEGDSLPLPRMHYEVREIFHIFKSYSLAMGGHDITYTCHNLLGRNTDELEGIRIWWEDNPFEMIIDERHIIWEDDLTK